MRPLFSTLAWLALPGALLAQRTGPYGPPAFTMIEVVPGVHVVKEPRASALSSFVHGNTVFVVNDADVLAVDASRTPGAVRSMLALLKGVTPKPVTRLLLTHHHGDHVLGVQGYVETFPGIEIIGTDSMRSAMIRGVVNLFATRPPDALLKVSDSYDSLYKAGLDMAGRPLTPPRRALFEMERQAFRHYYTVEARSIKPVPPTVTFEKKLTVWAGPRRIDMLSLGRGDTPGDAILWLPAERVVVTGDMLVDPVPYAGGTNPSEWLRTLRAVKVLDPLHIVPGHGEVMHDTKYLDLTIALIDSTLTAVRGAIAAGKTKEETVAQVTMEPFRTRFTANEPIAEDRWSIFIAGMVGGAYEEATRKP
ncbi:MAG: MBL fold metallo-hydrolase [Gemmatimonadales bacterium]|nr:MBL fold metallo-hydrolase [Gemmatimonadales bacterium]